MYISLGHVIALVDDSNNCHANVLKTIHHNKNTNMSQFHYAYFVMYIIYVLHAVRKLLNNLNIIYMFCDSHCMSP